MTDLQWFNNIDQMRQKPSDLVHDWLTKPYILSRALKRVCQRLEVKIIVQQFENASDDECALLNMDSNQLAFVRQVFLCGDDIPFTYGRVVIPPKTYDAHFSQFASLGTNLIGETLLYDNPDVSRGPFEYVYIHRFHPLEKMIFNELPRKKSHQDLWGRRSVFSIHDSPLLVMELLLPTLPEYKA
ncbi:MAG: chorismate lyase [Gammaproteobacteria bacterium]|jgi:chorismate--pyruvate lyase|nr:chorismate lyase [Gammaproteobacteria bacterium]